MAMQRGLIISLVLNVAWTTFWIPHFLYMRYWYPETLHFLFWALTVVIPGLISGLTLKTYFYQRLTWKDVLIIAALWFITTLFSGVGPVVVGIIYARRGLNASFNSRRGIFLAVLASVFYVLLWLVQIMVVYPLHVLSVDALPRVIQFSIGLGMLNAVALHFLLTLARHLGSPRPPALTEVTESVAG